MHERLALRLLRQTMDWNEDIATKEYRWLRLMSEMKYDGYRDYLAGVRFSESLAGWLNQFKKGRDREIAYAFIKERLTYYSPLEIQRLVEQLYPRFIEPMLRKAAALSASVPDYLVWADEGANREFNRRRRQVLIMGLSDGARLDWLRRANAGIIDNDQVVLATHLDNEKWIDLGEKLLESKHFAGESGALFRDVYLVDDFTGSGTSFVRQKNGTWTGKLKKFWGALQRARVQIEEQGGVFPLASDFTLHVHHYISSHQAREAIDQRLAAIKLEKETVDESWFHEIVVTEGLLLPRACKLDPATDPDMWRLCQTYYDDALSELLKEHLQASGIPDVRYGYGASALPVVLEHNCPNNAIGLLWADTEGEAGAHAMRPLFPRRHRHA